jgi:hypothetical protein
MQTLFSVFLTFVRKCPKTSLLTGIALMAAAFIFWPSGFITGSGLAPEDTKEVQYKPLASLNYPQGTTLVFEPAPGSIGEVKPKKCWQQGMSDEGACKFRIAIITGQSAESDSVKFLASAVYKEHRKVEYDDGVENYAVELEAGQEITARKAESNWRITNMQ